MSRRSRENNKPPGHGDPPSSQVHILGGSGKINSSWITLCFSKVRRNPLLCFRHAHSAVVLRRHAAGKSRGCSSRVHNVHKSNLYGTFTSVCVCNRLLASSLNVIKQICVCVPTRPSEQPRVLVRPSRVLPSRVVVIAPP